MARNSIGSLAVKLFGLGGSFLFAVAVARLLGPQGYGIVAVAISIATVAATVSLLGANELAVRAVAGFCARGASGDLARFLKWSIRTVSGTSVAAAVVLAGFSLVPTPYSKALLCGSILVPLLAMLQLLRGVIQGNGDVVAAQLPLDVVRWVAALLLIGALVIWASPPTAPTIIVTVTAALAIALAVAVIFVRSVGTFHKGGEIGPNRWFLESLPFLAIALFGIVGTEIGTVLLGWLSGPREAGLYQPIAKIAPILMIANQAIETALAPRIVQSWEMSDKPSIQRRISRSAFAASLATAAIGIAVVIAAPLILRAFGPEFTKYRSLLVWVAVAQVVNAASGSAPLLLAMTGDMKSRIGAQGATMVVQVGLGIALIPTFGAVGAVVALTAAIIIWSLLHWWLALRITGIDTSLFGILRRARSAG